jgi:DNA-binding Lrp family transcriptional regulator
MITPQDKKLLSVLKTNARASISDLARHLNLSRSTVQSRMLKLEQSGVIKGYNVDFGDDRIVFSILGKFEKRKKWGIWGVCALF